MIKLRKFSKPRVTAQDEFEFNAWIGGKDVTPRLLEKFDSESEYEDFMIDNQEKTFSESEDLVYVRYIDDDGENECIYNQSDWEEVKRGASGRTDSGEKFEVLDEETYDPEKHSGATKCFAVNPNMSWYGLFKVPINNEGILGEPKLVKSQLAYRKSDLPEKPADETGYKYYISKICGVTTSKKTSNIGGKISNW